MYPVIGAKMINGTETERTNYTITVRTITPTLMINTSYYHSSTNFTKSHEIIDSTKTIFNKTSTMRTTTPAGK